MNAKQALHAAFELIGPSAYIQRVAATQFVVGKNLGAPGVRDRLGRGLSWEEALENARRKLGGACREKKDRAT